MARRSSSSYRSTRRERASATVGSRSAQLQIDDVPVRLYANLVALEHDRVGAAVDRDRLRDRSIRASHEEDEVGLFGEAVAADDGRARDRKARVARERR